MNKKVKENIFPMILVVLDGWGIDSPNKGNAITLASTPTIDGLNKKYSYINLCAHGSCVGLPDSQSGNSEAGHMNIGAGRIINQDVMYITKAIKNKSFFKNPAFIDAIRHVKENNSKLHIMGLLSNGTSAHSDPGHMLALIDMAKKNGIKDICLHLFTDGRDSPKYIASKLVSELENILDNGECMATIMGRFYAMDRKKKWVRTEQAYDALVLGKGNFAKDFQSAISESYNKGDSDEYIEPYIIKNGSDITPRISDNDSIMFFNLRSDRARQLAKAFTQKEFNKDNPGSFKRKKVLKNIRFVAMTDFGPDLDLIITAFPSADLVDTLPMVLGESVSQLYIAESEKFAHVTYFFNGGYSGKVDGEDQVMIPSPDVKSYDEVPGMKSKELTKKVLKNLEKNKYDFTVLNYAAPDMIGHTGNLKAGIECCEIVDGEVEKIVRQYLQKNGTVIITADHGNVEGMINLKTGEIDTEHSMNPVPFIVINKKLKNIKLRKKGVLGDIVPTILDILNIQKPETMSGKSLVKK